MTLRTKRETSVGTKLLTGTAAMLVLGLVLGYSGMRSMARLKSEYDDTVDRTLRKVVLVHTVLTANSEMISAQRGLILAAYAEDPAEFEKYKAVFQQYRDVASSSIAEIRPLLTSEENKQLAAEIVERESEWQPRYQELLKRCQAGDLDGANHIRKDVTAPIYNRIKAISERMLGIMTDLLDQDKKLLHADYDRSHWIAYILLALSLCGGVGTVLVVGQINRSLRRAVAGLAQTAVQVASASAQIASSSQSLAQGASDQAASLEQTAASGEQINAMTVRNTERTSAAADLTIKSKDDFAAASQSLEQMEAAMTAITDSGNKISKIIKVIDEIAFQTNILALNAAVEAARAGEAGMGFAVVADEVRNLAQRCAQAARDTTSLIEESISKSNEGMAKVSSVVSAIRGITEQSSQVGALVEEVNLGSQEQARGIAHIGQSLHQMEKVTQTTAASAEQGAAAAEEMMGQSKALKEVIGHLSVMVGIEV